MQYDNSVLSSEVEISNFIELLNSWSLIKEALKRADPNEIICKLLNDRTANFKIVLYGPFPLLNRLDDSSLQ